MLVAVSAMCVSCTREEPEAPVDSAQVNTNEVVSAYAEAGNNQLLASVGDHLLTKGDVEKEVDLQIKFYERKIKSAKKLEQLRKSRIRIARHIVSSYVPRMVMVDYITKTNYQVSASARVAHQEKILKSLGKNGVTFDQFCTELGEHKDIFRTRFEYDLLTEDYLQNTFSNELTITESDIDKAIAHLKVVNANCIATNKFTRVKIAEICERAKKGEDFAKLSDKYSEDSNREPGGDLGECSREYFSLEPEVWDKLVPLKKGEISNVIETDYGFYVYQCRDRLEPGDERASLMLVLSEIYLKKAMSFPEQSREEWRKEGEEQQRQEVMGRILKGHIPNVKILKPRMDVLFPAKNKRGSKQKGKARP